MDSVVDGYSCAAFVLYYRRGAGVLDTLRDLLAQTAPPRRIVLVDNASDDGVADTVRRELPQVDVVQLPRNVGYGGAFNAAVRAHPGKESHLLFLTHEVRLASDCLERLMHSSRRRSAALVGPRLELGGSGATWSTGGSFDRRGRAFHLTSPLGSSSEQPGTGVVDRAWLDGAALLTTRTAFDAVDGFSEEFFLYWEDVDFGARCATVGPVLMDLSAVATQGTGFMPLYYAARNRIMFWRQWNDPAKVAWAVGAVIRAAAAEVRHLGPGTGARIHSLTLGALHGFTGGLNPAVAARATRRMR